jgi:hypothetical protein
MPFDLPVMTAHDSGDAGDDKDSGTMTLRRWQQR